MGIAAFIVLEEYEMRHEYTDIRSTCIRMGLAGISSAVFTAENITSMSMRANLQA